jgi:hypothetical protein
VKKLNGGVVEEKRYFIAGIEEAKVFAKSVRGHWGREQSTLAA